MLIQYRRWLRDNQRNESIEVLRDFLTQETELHSIARETLNSLGRKDHSQVKSNYRIFMAYQSSSSKNTTKSCELCQRFHPIWKCQEFLKQDICGRWDIAKQNWLCFRCLGTNHLGRSCSKGQKCGIDGCTLLHNRLLHRYQKRE